MELWTEYEGRTIDGAFPLKKLLLPEGRSAFFSTSNGNGDPTVIRLIASHFDEDEILARWRGVDALHHPNILRLEHYGQLILDDTTVVYAVMEPVDANLAEVIANQRLTLAEARQLAASLASALEVLHANGFVHEHVEPANIFAVGEEVKLRGDCIRETTEGAAAVEARRRDIHDLSIVLLQALTQETSPASALSLPTPFDRIIPNAIRGVWGLPEIKACLASGEPPRSTPPTAPSPVNLPISEQPKPPAGNFTPPAARPSIVGHPLAKPRFVSKEGLPPLSPQRIRTAAGILAAVLLLWLVWRFALSSRPATPGPQASTASIAQPRPAATSNTKPSVVTSPVAATRGQWRVIAYTYNRQDQAQKKAATLARSHPDIHPEVFTPTGRAPFLVAINGPMTRDQAYALVRRASHWNLPEDTYAQNYTGKSH
jgi:hypothetical protein